MKKIARTPTPQGDAKLMIPTERLKFCFPQMHHRRIEFIQLFVRAMIAAKTVNSVRVAEHFDSPNASADAARRRIERFVKGPEIDSGGVAKLILSFFDTGTKVTLCMDRTNWKSRNGLEINILCLALYLGQSTCIPLLFRILPHQGNSSVAERVVLLEKFREIAPHLSVRCLLADREFVGKDWMSACLNLSIPFVFRQRKNFRVRNASNQTYGLDQLFGKLKAGERQTPAETYYFKKVPVRISAQLSADGARLYTFSPAGSALTVEEYPKRWAIECMFKTLKSDGLNIEDTMVHGAGRVAKIFSMACLAYAFATACGVWARTGGYVRVRISNRGRLAESAFKTGRRLVVKIINPAFFFDWLIHMLTSGSPKTCSYD